MTVQHSTTLRNAILDTFETTYGTSPKFRYYTGSPPATCATAASGTLLVEIACPSDWAAAASGGSKAKSGTWSATASAGGVAGYYRIYDSAGSVCHEQGTVSQAITLATSATTSAGSNVLTFASTTGVNDGDAVTGTGIETGTTVLSHTSTTVTLSIASTAGVSSAVSITFGDTTGDLTISNTTIGSGNTVTVDTFTRIAPGA